MLSIQSVAYSFLMVYVSPLLLLINKIFWKPYSLDTNPASITASKSAPMEVLAVVLATPKNTLSPCKVRASYTIPYLQCLMFLATAILMIKCQSPVAGYYLVLEHLPSLLLGVWLLERESLYLREKFWAVRITSIGLGIIPWCTTLFR